MNRIVANILKLFLLVVWETSATVVFADSADTLSLFFAGDLMQHKAQLVAAQRPHGKYDYQACFAHVASEIKRADLAVGNLEVPLGGKPYTGYPAFSAPDDFARALRMVGFDVLLLSNNHCLDRGSRGACRTLSLLDSLKVLHTGVFRDTLERMHQYPLLVEKKGFRIAFLNYTYGTNGIRPVPPVVVNYIDREQIRKDVFKARMMRPDVIIACMHWGVEYELVPRKQDRELARWLLSLGVDHVIGAHPHVVQPVEVIPDACTPEDHLVAYSLGNFVSNMSARHTDGGMVVRMTLKKVAGHTRMASCGYGFVWTSRPVWNEKGDFLIYPSGIDDKLLNVKEKTGMKRYLEGARSLMQKYTKGIDEYFF